MPVLNMLPIKDHELEKMSAAMQAISTPIRLKIVCLLSAQEHSVNEILAQVGTGQSNISQHLGLLIRRGILSSRREAHFIYYRLNDDRMTEMITMVHKIFCH